MNAVLSSSGHSSILCKRHGSTASKARLTVRGNQKYVRLSPAAALDVREPTADVQRTPVTKLASAALQHPVTSLEQTFQLSGSSKRIVLENDELKSTWEHRCITGGTMALLAVLLGEGLSEINSIGDACSALGAAVFAYYLSDFLTGIYHWGVDNYGDGETPVVGSQIAAFQGHHQRPWTITEREFCNNLHKVFQPAAPFTLLCLVASHWTPAWLDIGLSTATFLTCMSQQFHAWAHMKASNLPAVVRKMQDNGVLVSRKAHGAHHKAPFEGNYCIVSGAWNPILDAGMEKDDSFFRRLERYVHSKTGVEPRCWHEPDYTWQEE